MLFPSASPMRTENEQIGIPFLRSLHDAVEYAPGRDLALNARDRSRHPGQARFQRDTRTLRLELDELRVQPRTTYDAGTPGPEPDE